MTESEVLKLPWFSKLCDEVAAAYKQLAHQQQAHAPALENERKELEQQVKGWSQSLAKSDLSSSVREHLEVLFDGALRRTADIEATIASRSADARQFEKVIDPAAVAVCLGRLAEIFTHSNASMGSIELAHHIDRIEGFSDGKVVVRYSRLGALAGAVELLSRADMTANESADGPARNRNKVTPRRLTRRRIESSGKPNAEMKARAIWATDPDRHAGLDDQWFEEVVLSVPKRKSWAEENAPAVAERRKEKKATEEQLAEHFGKSIPTIRASLRIARKTDPALRDMPKRIPRARWHEDNALLVARMSKEMGTNELVQHFGKSDVTIRKAIKYAEALAAMNGSPDGKGQPTS